MKQVGDYFPYNVAAQFWLPAAQMPRALSGAPIVGGRKWSGPGSPLFWFHNNVLTRAPERELSCDRFTLHESQSSAGGVRSGV